ncbi:calcium-binding protein [Nonomuraea longicatena]
MSSADRLRLRFELLDTDGSSVLTRADFVLYTSRVCRVLGVADGSPKAEALAAACGRYWENLAASADRDHDGRVTFEEYAALSHDPSWFAAHGEAYAVAIAAVGDLDDDGLIERDDFLGLHSAAGFPLAYAARLFGDLDRGVTGRVSTADFAAFVRDYYTSAADLL